MTTLISIAKIINFHGIKGEVKVGFTKGREKQLASQKVMFIKTANEEKQLTIENVRFNKTFAIIKFKEINSIDDTQLYKGANLLISKEIVRDSLEEDEYLVSDLDGLDVFDKDGNLLGVICAVGENSASNIINVKDKDNKTHLIPFVKELVPIVDIKNNKIIVNNIEGLIN